MVPQNALRTRHTTHRTAKLQVPRASSSRPLVVTALDVTAHVVTALRLTFATGLVELRFRFAILLPVRTVAVAVQDTRVDVEALGGQQQPDFFFVPTLSRTIFVLSPPGLGASPPASSDLRVTMR